MSVNFEGKVALVTGAGSGKTKILSLSVLLFSY